MNAAGKQHADLRRLLRIGHRFEQGVHHGIPQHQARHRPDMAAAFAAFEHEAPRALLEKHRQQPGRGHMQIARDAVAFQRAGLIGATARDQRERRAVAQRHLDLGADQGRRSKPQQPDTPGLALQPACHLGQQGFGCIRPHQRQRHHRQGPAGADRLGKGRGIADPGHRPLHDRPAGAMRPRHALPLAKHRALGRQRHRRGAVLLHGAGQTAKAAELPGKIGSKGGCLTQRRDLARRQIPAEGGLRHPGLIRCRGSGQSRAQRRRRPPARAFDPAPLHPARRLDQHRVGPGQPRQHRCQGLVQRRFAQQQQLIIQHHPGRPARAHRANRMPPRTKTGPAPAASACCNRMKAVASPTCPPAS